MNVGHIKRQISYLIIHNLRSALNVGAIFRTADCAGVTKIYLTGSTPAPIDRFGRFRADIKKSALGAERTLPWEYRPSIMPLLKNLKTDGVMLIGIEQTPLAVDYKKVKLHYPVGFIIGNEVMGLDKKILKICEIIAEIPVRGKKESLNVSVATGIALFRMLNV